MGKIAKIISSKIEDDKIICKCELYPDFNVQAELYLPPGESSMPLPDDITVLVEITGSGKYIACGLWSKAETIEKGERKLFSRDANGIIKSSQYMKKDGKIIFDADSDIEIKSDTKLKLMNGTDFAVRYNELKTQLDQLKSDFNNFIPHTHTFSYNAGPTPATGTTNTGTPGAVTTADFTNCKVSKINVPSKTED